MSERVDSAKFRTGALLRLAAILAGLMILVAAPAGSASAQDPDVPDAESYPPNSVVNLLDPVRCAPESISGEIGAVFPSSTVELELLINGTSANTITATAGVDGFVEYTIPVPPNQFGPAIVRANGTLWLQEIDQPGDPFSLDTSVTITACPTDLPDTGGSNTGIWVTIGLAALLAGGFLVAVSTRRGKTTAAA